LVPPEVTTFYNELTEEDKQILKEIASRHEEFQNEDQALEALKTKSEKLYNKVCYGKLAIINATHKGR
jgi:TRAP-type C4-dicarboxylate transport system substrate-binding protein